MLLSFKTSFTHKNFFNFTPDNCVRYEGALLDITRFFAGHCPMSGGNIQACYKINSFSVHYHRKSERKLYAANLQNYFETKTKQSASVLVQVVVST